MKVVSSWGFRLLGIYLMLLGLLALIPALHVIPAIVMSLLVLAAGALIFFGR